jgi:hypothetical protein
MLKRAEERERRLASRLAKRNADLRMKEVTDHRSNLTTPWSILSCAGPIRAVTIPGP